MLTIQSVPPLKNPPTDYNYPHNDSFTMAPKNNRVTPAKTDKEEGAGREAVNDAVDGVIDMECKTIVRLNKLKCYDNIQRKAEPNCFSVG